MFQLNFLEVLIVVVPVIVLFWKFYAVVYMKAKSFEEKLDKQADKIAEDEMRVFGRYIWSKMGRGDIPKKVDFSMISVQCKFCQAEVIFNGPGIFGWIVTSGDKNRPYSLYKLEPNIVCPGCHKELDVALVRRNEAFNHDWENVRGDFYDWKGKRAMNEPPKKEVAETTKEIMDDYHKEPLALPYKVLIFIATWGAVALAAYGLSFVPWTLIFWKLWELTKLMTYAFTRWWTLTGLAVTLLIFYRWHRQAIRDFYDYHKNLWRGRRRYRSMKENKSSLKEDQVRAYVNEVNGKEKVYDDLLKDIAGTNQTVSEDEIPF